MMIVISAGRTSVWSYGSPAARIRAKIRASHPIIPVLKCRSSGAGGGGGGGGGGDTGAAGGSLLCRCGLLFRLGIPRPLRKFLITLGHFGGICAIDARRCGNTPTASPSWAGSISTNQTV